MATRRALRYQVYVTDESGWQFTVFHTTSRWDADYACRQLNDKHDHVQSDRLLRNQATAHVAVFEEDVEQMQCHECGCIIAAE